MARFGAVGDGSEQSGWRPGLVFQNNTGNLYSLNLIMLPLTSRTCKKPQPTHVFLPLEETGLPKDSIVLCENPECMSKSRVGKYLTTVPGAYLRKVAAAVVLATSAASFLDACAIEHLRLRSDQLNSVGFHSPGRSHNVQSQN